MCLIVAKPKNKILNKQLLKNGWNENNHQGGFAYVVRNRVKIQKDFRNFRKFWRAYREVQGDSEEKSPAILIHFRLSSGSVISEENCHPFKINDRVVMAHNGSNIIAGQTTDKSDTRVFIDTIIKPMFETDPEIYKLYATGWLLREFIGSKNKIVFFDNTGAFNIINRDKGEEKDGIWFSNESAWKPRPRKIKKLTINGVTYSVNQEVWIKHDAICTNELKSKVGFISEIRDKKNNPAASTDFSVGVKFGNVTRYAPFNTSEIDTVIPKETKETNVINTEVVKTTFNFKVNEPVRIKDIISVPMSYRGLNGVVAGFGKDNKVLVRYCDKLTSTYQSSLFSPSEIEKKILALPNSSDTMKKESEMDEEVISDIVNYI